MVSPWRSSTPPSWRRSPRSKASPDWRGLDKAPTSRRRVRVRCSSFGDPVARKLAEWALLRHSDSEAGFERYVAFIRTNSDWPSIRLFRRRAEVRLWQERRDGTTVRQFVGEEPASSVGRLALARVLMSEGDRDGAAREVRAVWRSAELSAEMESVVLETFHDLLTRADHVARMDRRIGAKDFGAAMRAAKRVDVDQVAIVKAGTAAEAKSAKGGALLDAVSVDGREDLGYKLCRLHWLMRNNAPGSNLHGRIVTPKTDIAAAVKLALGRRKKICSVRTQTNGGVSVARWLANFSTSAMRQPPIRWCTSWRLRLILTIAQNFTS